MTHIVLVLIHTADADFTTGFNVSALAIWGVPSLITCAMMCQPCRVDRLEAFVVATSLISIALLATDPFVSALVRQKLQNVICCLLCTYLGRSLPAQRRNYCFASTRLPS